MLPSTSLAPDSVLTLAEDFYVSLRARNRAARTVETYHEAIEQFDAFLASRGMPRRVAAVRREHIEAFLDYLLNEKVDPRRGTRLKPATAKNRHASLQAFFRWLLEEGEVRRSPMATVLPPRFDVAITPVLTLDEVGKMLGACRGDGLRARRDTAIIRLLFECGLRRAELRGLTLADVDVHAGLLTVRRGKGNRARLVPFGAKTAQALTRYLRVRRGHRLAALPDLWLGKGGPMTDSGIAQVIRDRGRMVVPPIDPAKLHPHALRHTWAHHFRMAEGSDTDLMTLAGWRSPQMLRRYGAAAAQERAIAAHHRVGLGERL